MSESEFAINNGAHNPALSLMLILVTILSAVMLISPAKKIQQPQTDIKEAEAATLVVKLSSEELDAQKIEAAATVLRAHDLSVELIVPFGHESRGLNLRQQLVALRVPEHIITIRAERKATARLEIVKPHTQLALQSRRAGKL